MRLVAGAAQGERPLAEVLERACHAIAAGYGFDRVAISRLLATQDKDWALVVATAGRAAELPGTRMAVSEGSLLRRARETGRLVVSSAPAAASSQSEIVARESIAFALPLLNEGRCIGWLTGDCAGAPLALDEAEADVLATIGVLLATIIEKELLYEQMRVLDEAKTQFVALASHELRTPVQTVYGVLSTLHLRGEQLEERQLIELRLVAYEQAVRLRRLVEQLLDLSRIDAAAAALKPQPTRLRRKLEEIVLLVAEQRARDVTIEVPSALVLSLDPEALDRIVSNLLGNALRYGAAPIRIEATQQDRHLRLRVEDAGEGIDPDFLPTLFERFTRSEHSGAESIAGSGLGLSIAQSFARAHGGEILYHPVEPHGACFELVLPLQQR